MNQFTQEELLKLTIPQLKEKVEQFNTLYNQNYKLEGKRKNEKVYNFLNKLNKIKKQIEEEEENMKKRKEKDRKRELRCEFQKEMSNLGGDETLELDDAVRGIFDIERRIEETLGVGNYNYNDLIDSLNDIKSELLERYYEKIKNK